MSYDAPLTIGIVGTGRVGSGLAAALAAAGHHVTVATGTLRHGPAPVEHSPVERLARGPDLVVVAVPDDALAATAHRLAGGLTPGTVVAHTSGAHGLAVLAPVVAAGGAPLALHPAMPFTGTPADLDRLAGGIRFGVTVPPHAPELRALAQRLVADLRGAPEWIAEEQRPLYHAALAHGANHLVTLVNEAADRLRDAGVHAPDRVLAPLLAAALHDALRRGDAALTGPVSRGDAGTVAAHLRALGAVAPESVPPYVALARRTTDRAIVSGRLPATAAAAVLDVLTSVPAGSPAAVAQRPNAEARS